MFEHLQKIDTTLIFMPEDDDEFLMVECFMLSLQSGFSGASYNSEVLKAFSEEHELNFLETLKTIQRMLGEFNLARKV